MQISAGAERPLPREPAYRWATDSFPIKYIYNYKHYLELPISCIYTRKIDKACMHIVN